MSGSIGDPMPPGEPVWRHVERIEQAGSRVVVTGGGVVHDFLSCDGTNGRRPRRDGI